MQGLTAPMFAHPSLTSALGGAKMQGTNANERQMRRHISLIKSSPSP